MVGFVTLNNPRFKNMIPYVLKFSEFWTFKFSGFYHKPTTYLVAFTELFMRKWASFD